MELSLEQHIVHQLLLRSSMGKDVGLFHGKMGLIIFFAHYFKHTGQQVYDDTASELMIEMNDETHKEFSVGFANGLSGIGWGIEYLIQNGYSTDDSMGICEEIDKKIMGKDPLRITDYSLDTGLEGILHYVLAHIKGVMSHHSELPFDERYLNDLHQAITSIPQNTELSEDFKRLSAQFFTFNENRNENDLDYSFQLAPILDDVDIKQEGLNSFPLGLKDGMSGYLLRKLITNSI